MVRVTDAAGSDGDVLPVTAGVWTLSRVPVVEDDDSIGVPLVEGLEFEGFTPKRVRTGPAAVESVDDAHFVLLDLEPATEASRMGHEHMLWS